MADIVEIGNGKKVPEGQTALDVAAAAVLQGGIDEGLEHVVVIGWTPAGEFYMASSYGNEAESVYLLELAKQQSAMRFFGWNGSE